jgi:diacylglycerol kinase family enzyme
MEWALISDVDYESEWMRGCCGGLRFQFEFVKQVLFLRRYNGQLDYLPEDSSRDASFLQDANEEFFGIFSTAAAEASAPRSKLLPPASSFEGGPPEGWQRIEGNFNMCIAMLAPYLDTSTPVAPDHRMGDGIITLITSLGLGRCPLIKAFLRAEEGRHLEDGQCKATRARAFRVKPEDSAPAAIGIDGEIVAGAREPRLLEAVIYPGVLRLCMT